MVNKKVTATKKPAVKAKKPAAKAKAAATPVRVPAISDDFKNALLVVSVTINLAIFIGWLALKLSNEFDTQVFHMLFK